jgi:hypothetical protein
MIDQIMRYLIVVVLWQTSQEHKICKYFCTQSYQNEIMRYDMHSDIRFIAYLIMRHDTCHILCMRWGKRQNFQICIRTEFLLTQSYCFSSAGHENTVGLGDVVVLPRANVIKLFPPKFTNFRNKLECLSVASFSSQVKWLGGKARSLPLRWAHERKARYSITSKY